MMYQRSLFCSLSLCWAICAQGYEVDTHGAITQQSYVRSALATSNLLAVLGLEEGDSPFGDLGNNYDVSGAEVAERTTGEIAIK
jgi:hypothetical protein